MLIKVRKRVPESTEVIRDPSGMGVEELIATWERRVDRIKGAPPRWLLVLGLQYDREISARRKALKPVSATMWRRFKMCKEFDVAGLRRESDFLKPVFADSTETTGGIKMKTKEKRKPVTAISIVQGLKSSPTPLSDQEIVRRVRRETGSDKFDLRQLAWYRWKLNQNGHKAKKKIVVKKK